MSAGVVGRARNVFNWELPRDEVVWWPGGPAAAQMHARRHLAPATTERRLNFGHQTLPSGLSAFPVARKSDFHRSINQQLPELWPDFSDRGSPGARVDCSVASRFHGDEDGAAASAKHGKVVFVGYASFEMDGRAHTAGEMDRLMMSAAAAKYPCARPCTFDEYADGVVLGLPQKNLSGRDVAFVGLGATGCNGVSHSNTLGAQKAIVPPGDFLDGSWGAVSLYGWKSILCVVPAERMRRQQSLMQFGLARATVGKSGGLRRASSLSGLSDRTPWTTGDFGVMSSLRRWP